jgi:CheY-like chemotaxis protein
MTVPTMATDGSHLQQVALERRHALVVDDTSVMRKAIQRILAQDFIVIEAKHGDGVWEIITSQHTIQVVFVDLMYPTGMVFICRATSANPRTRVSIVCRSSS